MNAFCKPHMRSWAALAAGVMGMAVLAAEPHAAVAQANAKQKQSAAASKAAPGTAKSAPRTAAPKQPIDTVAQQVVLQSAEWQRMMAQFNDWLSDQSLYDSDQVKQIKQRLDAAIQKMSAEQLKTFMAQMLAKLDVLTSERAKDAQDYLAETLSVASPAYARRMHQQMPDVLTMTAGQIDQRLTNFASKRQNLAQMQKTFDNSRQQQIAYNQARLKARQESQERALDRAESAAAAAGSGQSDVMPARDYYPWLGDQYDSSLRYFGGWGWYGPTYIGAHRF